MITETKTMWAVHDGPGKIEWGPFSSQEKARTFIHLCLQGDNYSDIHTFEVEIPDYKILETNLQQKLEEYRSIYAKWKGDSRTSDLKYVLIKPKTALCTGGYAYGLTRSLICDWYATGAHINPLRHYWYFELRDFKADVKEWIEDAEAIISALDRAITWLTADIKKKRR